MLFIYIDVYVMYIYFAFIWILMYCLCYLFIMGIIAPYNNKAMRRIYYINVDRKR